MINVYHQCGFREKWNFDSYKADDVGDGFILSPVNLKRSKLETLEPVIKNISSFDPQFYLPRSEHKNLNDYNFFPNHVTDGYDTVLFEENAQISADKCISFQIDNNFEKIIIPTLFVNSDTSEHIERIDALITQPFLTALDKHKNLKKDILITLIINENQLKDGIVEEFFNYYTSHSQIDGIYLIPYHKRASKRIKDIDYLFNLMKFIDVFKVNDLQVHLGYSDIESYVLTITDVDSITIGSYENLRKFNPSRFVPKDKDDVKRAPTPRVYSAKLFQWIDHRYISTLKSDYEHFDMLFDNTDYQATMFNPDYNWHFMKPELYKHYFLSYSNQISNLPYDYEERYQYMSKHLKNASNHFKYIDDCGIILDSNSDGSHLTFWRTALNKFYKYKRGE